MANRRELKKKIDAICSELFAEAVAVSIYGKSATDEDTNAQLKAILQIRSDFISRVSHKEPGMEGKEYFHKLIDDFKKQVNEVVDQINNAI